MNAIYYKYCYNTLLNITLMDMLYQKLEAHQNYANISPTRG